MYPHFNSTIVVSLASRIARRQQLPPPTVQHKRRPPTLHIKLPGPLPAPVGMEGDKALHPSSRRQFQLENLVVVLGEERIKRATKGVLVQFVMHEEEPSIEDLRDFVWLAGRLCDPEFIEILAEIANRCFLERHCVGIGLAALDVLGQQRCSYSRSWLNWLMQMTMGSESCQLVRCRFQERERQLRIQSSRRSDSRGTIDKPQSSLPME